MDSREYIETHPKIRLTTVVKLFISHNVTDEDEAAFFEEYGTHSFYKTSEVLGWLGY